MKTFLDTKAIRDISEDDKKILADRYPADTLQQEIELLVKQAIDRLIEGARNDLIQRNIIKYKADNATIPSDDTALAKLIMAKTDYKDAAARLAEITTNQTI